MEEEVMKTCLRVINTLSKPQLEEIQGAMLTVDNVLESNFKIAVQQCASLHDQGNHDELRKFGLDNCHVQDTRWAYSCLCLEMLLQVSKTVEVDNINLNTNCSPKLSVQNDKDMAKCYQLVIAFGLLPHLLPRVGVPAQKRSKWNSLCSISANISDEQKYSRMTTTVRALCHLEHGKVSGPNLAVKHLDDILAALLQLCHASISKPTTNSEVLLWQRMQQERQQEFFPLLNSLLERTYPPLLVQSLLLLQGPSASQAKVIRDAPPPAPRWLVRVCASLLTQQLMKPNGVIGTIQGLLELGDISPDMWQRCDSLACIISTPPGRDEANQRAYYSIIGPQLLELVQRSSKDLSDGPFMRIGSGCYRDIAMRHRQVAEESVFGPLFQPLSSDDQDELIRCIETLHSVFVDGTAEATAFLQLLEPHSRRLVQLYRLWCQGILQVKALLEELLVRLIRHNDSPDRVGLLRSLLTVEAADTEDESFLDEDERSVAALLSLLQSVNDVHLTYSVFVSLLEDLPLLLTVEPLSDSSLLGPREPHLLQSVRRGLMTLKLIGTLSEDERLQRYLLDHPHQAVGFAQVFLQRAADNLDQREHFDLDLEKEGLAIVFAVIALQIEHLVGREGKSNVWGLFDPLTEPLELLAKKHSLERIRSGADELRVAIQTRGFVFEKRPGPGSQAIDAFTQAWDQLSDPLLPVQGHGILTLSHLLKRKDPQALKNREQLLKVFIGSLEHEDSYIYLMAVQALTALADVYTDEVVHALVRQLEQVTGSAETPTAPEKLVKEVDDESKETEDGPAIINRPPEVRLKVGEALLHVVRLIGPLVPKYKRVLLDSFLRGTKDLDPFVRASCLHNLGELCGLLMFSLDCVTHELMNCVSNLVQRDPAVEVRRAAVLLITLLLKGLDKEALLVLEPIIKDVYRMLKDIVLRDDDDRILTYHATQALEKLAEIVKEYLNPKRQTGKTIYQLRLP